MGVKVREKIKRSGEWWIFINHKGFRWAKPAISFADTEMVAKLLEELSSNSSE